MKTAIGDAVRAAFPTEVPSDCTVTLIPLDYPESSAMLLDTQFYWRREGLTEPWAMTVGAAQVLGLIPDPLLLELR